MSAYIAAMSAYIAFNLNLTSELLACLHPYNGVDMPALLDTGAPTTIFNGAAAEAAGLSLEAPSSEAEEASARAEAGGGGGGMNPFSVRRCRLTSG